MDNLQGAFEGRTDAIERIADKIKELERTDMDVAADKAKDVAKKPFVAECEVKLVLSQRSVNELKEAVRRAVSSITVSVELEQQKAPVSEPVHQFDVNLAQRLEDNMNGFIKELERVDMDGAAEKFKKELIDAARRSAETPPTA